MLRKKRKRAVKCFSLGVGEEKDRPYEVLAKWKRRLLDLFHGTPLGVFSFTPTVMRRPFLKSGRSVSGLVIRKDVAEAKNDVTRMHKQERVCADAPYGRAAGTILEYETRRSEMPRPTRES